MTSAFVLSGGASLGAIQVGMLKALYSAGVAPDVLVGTSVGAVNAAWMAADGEITELEAIWRGLRRGDVFPLRPLRGLLGFAGRQRSLVDPAGLRRLLQKHARLERLENAAIPLHVVVVDVLSGRDLLLSAGDAVDAVAASAAIPGVFPPVRIDGRFFMDGGVVNNTPISHAVALGADTIWVLPAGYSCSLSAPPESALGMALHGLNVLVQHRLARDVARFEPEVDLRVVPPLCPVTVSPADFSQSADLIDRARDAIAAWLTEPGPTCIHQAALLEPHTH